MTTLSRYRGDTYPVKYVVKDTSGVVVDVSGWSFIMTIDTLMNPPDNTTKIAEVIGVLDAPTLGEVSFAFAGLNLAVGTLYYDVQSVDGASIVRTLAKGMLIINQDITK